ncbi:MAG: hypothetical protein ACTH3S_11215 [Marinobacter sp.]|uniref:hypothetical protein n=1 Tax=Marinobacter sp. TaxID=50741 RepID=UPI003F99F31E
MNARFTAQQISKALFDVDPMNTCCRENDCFDEYDYVAEAVTERLAEGLSLDHALVEEVSNWFFDGAHFDVSRLTLAFKLLREE